MFQKTIGNETYITPKDLQKSLGHFNLDPACPDEGMYYSTADKMITKSEDGLSFNWKGYGRVWCNPPYGKELYTWLNKFLNEADSGLFLMFNRMDSKSFQYMIKKHKDVSIIILNGRIKFHTTDGNENKYSAPCGSILICKNEDLSKLKHLNGLTLNIN